MYEAGKATRVGGCLVVVVGLLAVATCAMHSFFDVSSNQSAAACKAIMRNRILAKVSALPPDEVLKAKGVVVEHDLRGNRDQTEPLARLLRAQGKSTRVDPLEVGTTLVIQDRSTSFRKHASERIDAICNFAAANHLQYDSWWVSGDRFSEYVSQ